MAARRFKQPPVWDAIDHSVRALDKTAELEIKYINSYKGRGVFAKAPFLKGDFVVEYRGGLISSEESQRRRSIYHSRCTVFMFDFYCRERAWCVDAAQEDGTLGRLVNDDHYHPNCKIKKVVTEGKPRLFLFAMKDISAGEEITYAYRGTDCPWRIKAGPQTAVPEGSRTSEEAHQMKTPTLSSDSELSVEEEEQDPASGQERTRTMQSLPSEIDSDSEPYNSGDDSNQYTSEDGTDTSDDVEPLGPTKDTLQCLNSGSLKPLPGSTSSPLAHEAGEAAGSLCAPVTYEPTQHCLFCKLGVGEIARHLEQTHRNEPAVVQAFSFPTGSKERQMCLERLISRGNFAHSVTNAGVGKACVQAACAPPPPAVKGDFGRLFEDTVIDATYHAMHSDVYIMEYGQDLYNRLRFKDGKQEYVRYKMRELGRLLIYSRKTSAMKTIGDHITPANFMHVVQAVKHLAGFDGETNTFKSPSATLKIGNSLANIARLVESRATQQNNYGVAQDARAFHKLYVKRWKELVSAASRKALRENRYTAPLLLAFTQDVQHLHCYLDVQRQRFQADLNRRPSIRAWSRLAKVTLAQVILFNRRRTRQVSNMPLAAYVSPGPQEDADEALPHIEKKLCRNTRRLEMTGKRGVKVVVLLTPTMQQSLDLLVSNRQACKVPLGNVHLFGIPCTLSCYRGSDTLRSYARVCGAKNPTSLSCPKLSRQSGTLSLVLNLGNAELAQLADLIGPGVRVHQQFYRIPAGALQLAKISKVLLDLDRGRRAQFTGKSLEDIIIEPNETVPVPIGKKKKKKKSGSQDSLIAPTQMWPVIRGRQLLKNRWQREEVFAVEKHMMSFITSGRIPAKTDCQKLLRLETEALKNRSWTALKYYINNRIHALRGKALKDL